MGTAGRPKRGAGESSSADSRPGDSAASPPGDGGPGAVDAGLRSVTERVASALGEAADYVESAASAVGSAASAVGSAASAVGAAVGATARRFDERPGARVRRVRRLGQVPLPYLYAVHPDARRRTPRELGLRTIDVADVAGTAVGGAQQRGSDFLPLKPFRTINWLGRWQRLNQAFDALTTLPPIDVLRYDDKYWVVDGHNRVAIALYRGQSAIDADVVDLVDANRPPSEPAESFASLVEDSRELRAAVSRAAPPPSPAAPDPEAEPAPDGEPAARPDGSG